MESSTEETEIEKFSKAEKGLKNPEFTKFLRANIFSFIKITDQTRGGLIKGITNPDTFNIMYNVYADYLKDPSILDRINKLKKKTSKWIINGKEEIVTERLIEDMYNELGTLEIIRRQTINKYLDDAKLVLPIVEIRCSRCQWRQSETFSLQVRSSDEGETTFYRCVRCRQTWAES